MLRQLLIGTVLFALLGVPVSREILVIFGLEANYLALIGGGTFIALMLLSRSFLLVSFMALLTISINLPDQVLFDYGVDKVALIAVLLIIVLYPSINKVMNN